MNSFDIIGPIMIGPSSSHTAGAARIGRIGLEILKERAVKADILLHGSFAKTYKGHGTDRALVAGIMGMSPDNPDLRDSLSLAEKEGLLVRIRTGKIDGAHPNTARLHLTGESGRQIEMEAASTGGGNVRVTSVNKMTVSFTCEKPTLIVLHHDVPGVIASVAEMVSKNGVNICSFHLSRGEKGGMAVMTLEMDSVKKGQIFDNIMDIPEVRSVTYLASV